MTTRLRCSYCRNDATCVGRYEGHGPLEAGCDDHCGHGCEDGSCRDIEDVLADDGEDDCEYATLIYIQALRDEVVSWERLFADDEVQG